MNNNLIVLRSEFDEEGGLYIVDGSQFWGIEILHNKKEFRKRVNEYIAHGYVTEGIFTV